MQSKLGTYTQEPDEACAARGLSDRGVERLGAVGCGPTLNQRGEIIGPP
jgi:hypothetical protein